MWRFLAFCATPGRFYFEIATGKRSCPLGAAR
jgi:hypothetical protein